MKHKSKKLKLFKSAFIFILLICLVASSVPITFAATPTVKSVDIEDIELIKNTNRYLDYEYNEKTEECDLEYFRYSYYHMVNDFTVTLSDGTVLQSNYGSVDYLGTTYYVEYISDDQSYANQWDIGTHQASAEIMGYTATFNVNIIDTPIKDIQISDINILENTNIVKDYDYNPSTDEWDLEYNKYSYNPEYTIYFKDGTINKTQWGFIYNDEYYSLNYTDDQSYTNHWGVGTHTVTAEVLGYKTTFNVNIIENEYKSLEILEVKPLEEKSNTNHSNSYQFPKFKYKVTKKDGTSFVDMYMDNRDFNDDKLIVPNDYDREIRKNWSVGKDNSFVVSYANIKATVNVEIIPSSGYEYIEQNGGLYITNVKEFGENLVIPSEINGVKVIGIPSLGDATESVKNLTIPDTVNHIGDDALRWCTNLKTLTLGSNINYLDADMFSKCNRLESINISADNKNYTSVDGVVYNIEKDTLIVYPLGKGNDYEVPASVSNIDALDSWQYLNVNVIFSDASSSFKTIDGVTYTADMTKVIRCNTEKSGEYIMPNTVTKIRDNAFSNCEKLTNVKISDNVTEIVYRAFENCTALASVSMPNTVTSIGEYAFNNCISLNDVSLPEELVKIDYMAFKQCNISDIIIPDKVKSIGAHAFSDNRASKVSIGKSVEEIGGSAFGYENIENIVIPDNVIKMDNAVFYGCKNLKNVHIGKGITTIAPNTFSECESLTNISIPEHIKEIGSGAFSSCGLTEITIPKNINYINSYTFSGCENLNNVIFKSDSVIIGDSAFSGCPLKNFKPDTNISSYGKFCFIGSGIESVNVSKTVTEIAYGSFAGCKDLSSINIPESVLKIGGRSLDNTKWYNSQSDGPVYLDHIFYKYKGKMPENTNLNIKKGTKTIADYALCDCKNLTEITLPDGLKRIGALALFNCNQITSLNIPASVEDIGPYALANCKSLTEINVSSDNKYYTSVDGVLFNKDMTELIYCPKQNTDTYVVPTSVKKIKAFAFDSGCVDNITITNKDIELEEHAFGANLCRIILPEYSSANTTVRYCNISVSCPKDSTTKKYANEHLIDVFYVEPQTQTGDVNGDGIINITDATDVQKYLAELIKLDSTQMLSADMNGDGVVSIIDSTEIQKYLVSF